VAWAILWGRLGGEKEQVRRGGGRGGKGREEKGEG